MPATTTTQTPSNGVTVSPTSASYGNYGGQEQLSIANPAAITSMTITITVAQTAGVTFNQQFDSFPGGSVSQTWSTQGGAIVYTWVLQANKTIPANYAGGTGAQFAGTGSPHANSGDRWSVTSTANGVQSTVTGTF